jgi:2-polyprenyl-3-methyl-5-hydroxy-6-metoxy-1,4-benzoquinol methylase
MVPTIDEQRDFWDWHWEHWQERKTINEWKNRRHETILSSLHSLSLEHPRILDLGCGPGWYTESLASFGTTTGVDISEEAIRMAKSRFPNIQFIAGNLYDLPLPTEHFDVVVSQEVFDHVEDQIGFIERVAYFLKPRGYLILSCANKFVMDRLEEGKFPVQPDAHIARYVNRKELKHLIEAHFRFLRVKSILPIGHRGILRLVNSHKINAVLKYVLSSKYLEEMKERLGLGHQLIILAQKKGWPSGHKRSIQDSLDVRIGQERAG